MASDPPREPPLKVPGQVLVRKPIVCPWCGVKAQQLRTRPEAKRSWYECRDNCFPNNPQRTRTIFAVPIRD